MSLIRVLLADDHMLFRAAIKNLLLSESDIQIIGEASNSAEAIERAAELRPDVVLMDIGMPGMSSFEATRQMKKARPEVKVVYLTMY
jgi:two-component system response regulator NreC